MSVLAVAQHGAEPRACGRLGGFDEHFVSAAEDCDLCYRWLRAGRSLRYEPGMVVWHDDWRDDAQLDRLHTYYQYWLAFFYAKHRAAATWHPAIRDAEPLLVAPWRGIRRDPPPPAALQRPALVPTWLPRGVRRRLASVRSAAPRRLTGSRSRAGSSEV